MGGGASRTKYEQLDHAIKLSKSPQLEVQLQCLGLVEQLVTRDNLGTSFRYHALSDVLLKLAAGHLASVQWLAKLLVDVAKHDLLVVDLFERECNLFFEFASHGDDLIAYQAAQALQQLSADSRFDSLCCTEGFLQRIDIYLAAGSVAREIIYERVLANICLKDFGLPLVLQQVSRCSFVIEFLKESSDPEDISLALDALTGLCGTKTPASERMILALLGRVSMDELQQLCVFRDVTVQISSYLLISELVDVSPVDIDLSKLPDECAEEWIDEFLRHQGERNKLALQKSILKRMMASLHAYSSDDELVFSLSKCFCALCAEVSVRADIYHSIGHSVLSVLLDSSCDSCEEFLIQIVRAFSETSSLCLAMFEDGNLSRALRIIQRMLSEWTKFPESYVDCLHIVMHLTDMKQMVEMVISLGVMDAVSFCALTLQRADEQLFALRSMACVAALPAYMDVYSRKVGCNGILRLVRTFDVQFALPGATLLALVTATEYYAAHQFSADFCEGDGIVILWNIVQDHSNHFQLLISCLACIANISAQLSCQAAVLEHVPPSYFVELLQSKESSLKTLATKALQSISVGSTDMKKLVIDTGIPALARAMPIFDEAMCENAAAVVWNISADRTLLQLMVERGGFDIMSIALKKSSILTGYYSLSALVNLAAESELKHLIVSAELFGNILQWTSVRDKRIQLPALSALALSISHPGSLSCSANAPHSNSAAFLNDGVLDLLFGLFQVLEDDNCIIELTKIFAILALHEKFVFRMFQCQMVDQAATAVESANTAARLRFALMFVCRTIVSICAPASVKDADDQNDQSHQALGKDNRLSPNVATQMVDMVVTQGVDGVIFAALWKVQEDDVLNLSLTATLALLGVHRKCLKTFMDSQGADFAIQCLSVATAQGQETAVEILRLIMNKGDEVVRRDVLRAWGEKKFIEWIIAARKRSFRWRAYDIYVAVSAIVKWHLNASIDYLFSLLKRPEKVPANMETDTPMARSASSDSLGSAAHLSPISMASPKRFSSPDDRPLFSPHSSIMSPHSAHSESSAPSTVAPFVEGQVLISLNYILSYSKDAVGLDRMKAPIHVSLLNDCILSAADERNVAVKILLHLSAHDRCHESIVTNITSSGFSVMSSLREPHYLHRAVTTIFCRLIRNELTRQAMCIAHVFRCLLEIIPSSLAADDENHAIDCVESLNMCLDFEVAKPLFVTVNGIFSTLCESMLQFEDAIHFRSVASSFLRTLLLNAVMPPRAHDEGAFQIYCQLVCQENMEVQCTIDLLEGLYFMWLLPKTKYKYYKSAAGVLLLDTVFQLTNSAVMGVRCISLRLVSEMLTADASFMEFCPHCDVDTVRSAYEGALSADKTSLAYRTSFGIGTDSVGWNCDRVVDPLDAPTLNAGIGVWECLRASYFLASRHKHLVPTIAQTAFLLHIAILGDSEVRFWASENVRVLMEHQAFVVHCRDLLMFRGSFLCLTSPDPVLRRLGKHMLFATGADHDLYVRADVADLTKLIAVEEDDILHCIVAAIPFMVLKTSVRTALVREQSFGVLNNVKHRFRLEDCRHVARALATVFVDAALVPELANGKGILLVRHCRDVGSEDDMVVRASINSVHAICVSGTSFTHKELISLNFISALGEKFSSLEVEMKLLVLKSWSVLAAYPESESHFSKEMLQLIADYLTTTVSVPVRHALVASELLHSLSFYSTCLVNIIAQPTSNILISFMENVLSDTKSYTEKCLLNISRQACLRKQIVRLPKLVQLMIERLSMETESLPFVLKIVGNLCETELEEIGPFMLDHQLLKVVLGHLNCSILEVQIAAVKPLQALCSLTPSDAFLRGTMLDLWRLLSMLQSAASVSNGDELSEAIAYAMRGMADMAVIPAAVRSIVELEVVPFLSMLLQRVHTRADVYREGLRLLNVVVSDMDGWKQFSETDNAQCIVNCAPFILRHPASLSLHVSDRSRVEDALHASRLNAIWLEKRKQVKEAWERQKLLGYVRIVEENGQRRPFRPRTLLEYLTLDSDIGSSISQPVTPPSTPAMENSSSQEVVEGNSPTLGVCELAEEDMPWFAVEEVHIEPTFRLWAGIVEKLCHKVGARFALSGNEDVLAMTCFILRHCIFLDTLFMAAKCAAFLSESEASARHLAHLGCVGPLCSLSTICTYFQAFPCKNREQEFFIQLQQACCKCLANISVHPSILSFSADDLMTVEVQALTSKDKLISTYASIFVANTRQMRDA